jgi:hypothetical protein
MHMSEFNDTTADRILFIQFSVLTAIKLEIRKIIHDHLSEEWETFFLELPIYCLQIFEDSLVLLFENSFFLS